MIKLDNVVFNYQSMPMVFDLHIQTQEKIAIIGESGAGKSTLLNLIAGFEYADSGEIWLNGENHTKTAPFERPVSMLFQENNLFTHLSVEDNIALGLKPNLALNAEEKALVEQAASAVNLQDFLTRKPTALSGGQKQRVALARCLLRDKPILLLDDVLSELDRNRQNYLLEHIKGIQTIITCTGLEEFVKNGINIQKTFEIESGKVKR